MTRRQRIEIAERVRRCKFCQREMQVSALAYLQNPRCVVCLPERMRSAAPTAVTWRTRGHYVEPLKKES